MQPREAADGLGRATDLAHVTRGFLELGAERLASVSEHTAANAFRGLSSQVDEPCVVAVFGPVSAGKSTFINALLGEDLALTGMTETTATVNWFRFGMPDPLAPVRCVWKGGTVTREHESFLDVLKGAGVDSLERAARIDHLEYLSINRILQRMVLVDTPGTGAAITEQTTQTEGFLTGDLRLEHDHETRRLRESADAVIYVVGTSALASDRDLLRRFRDATGSGSSTSNALAVVTKIDDDAACTTRRDEVAESLSRQLRDVVTTVVPVSAGLARILESNVATIGEVILRLLDIPGEFLEAALESEEMFCDMELTGCPVSASQRSSLRLAIAAPWGVFATIARTAGARGDVETAIRDLEAIAGFGRLRSHIRDLFLDRGQLLRCFRILKDAEEVIGQVRFRRVREVRADTAKTALLNRFLVFAKTCAETDPDVASELTRFLREQLGAPRRDKVPLDVCSGLRAELSDLLRRVSEDHADFAALQELRSGNESFTDMEWEELRALLGSYGDSAPLRLRAEPNRALCISRQLFWREIHARSARGSIRERVAERAASRLGWILADIADGAP